MPKIFTNLNSAYKPAIPNGLYSDLSTTDTTNIQNNSYFYCYDIGYFYKLYKDGSLSIPTGTFYESEDLTVVAPNNKDVWVCQDPYVFNNAPSPLLPEVGVFSGLPFNYNAVYTEPSDQLQYKTALDYNFAPFQATTTSFAIFATGVVTLKTNPGIIYDQRFVAMGAAHNAQVPIVYPLNGAAVNYEFPIQLELFTGYLRVTFLNFIGPVTVSYMTGGALPTT